MVAGGTSTGYGMIICLCGFLHIGGIVTFPLFYLSMNSKRITFVFLKNFLKWSDEYFCSIDFFFIGLS